MGDNARVTFTADAGETYFIAVGAFGNYEGTYTLSVTDVTEQFFIGGVPMSSGPASVRHLRAGRATRGTGAPAPPKKGKKKSPHTSMTWRG